MDSTSTLELTYQSLPIIRIYEDGTVHRLIGTATVPPSLHHPTTNSKDVIFSPEFNLISRLYIPKSLPSSHHKIPLLVYFHGGGFCLHSAFSPEFHAHLNRLAAEANVLIVSVNYRKAPEFPLPAAYEDGWMALKWVASHSNGDGLDDWINHHADLGRVFIGGDSAGGNLAHNLAIRCGVEKLGGVNVNGLVAVQPLFAGDDFIEGEQAEDREYGEKLWKLAKPTSSGFDDPSINPGLDPNLSKMGCSRVVVFVAGNDELAVRDRWYCETLKKSGWNGSVEMFESKDEQHVFHIREPDCDNALELMKKFVSFLNQDE